MGGLRLRPASATPSAAPAAPAAPAPGGGGAVAARRVSHGGASRLVAVAAEAAVMLFDTRTRGPPACALPLPRGVEPGWVQLCGGRAAARLLLAPTGSAECRGVHVYDVRALRRARPLCRVGDGTLRCFDAAGQSLIAGGPNTPTRRWGDAATRGGVDDDAAAAAVGPGAVASAAAEQRRKAGKARQHAARTPRAKHRLAGGPVNVRR